MPFACELRAVRRNTHDRNTSALEQDWFRKHSTFEKCMKILELLHRLLDQKLGNFHEERMHSYEKYSVKITTEKKMLSDEPGIA